MAVNNYIKDMQKKIEYKKNFDKTIKELLALKNKTRNIFIMKSVSEFLENDKLELKEAQKFVIENQDHMSFEVENIDGLSEHWTLKIKDKEYKMKFNVTEKKEK